MKQLRVFAIIVALSLPSLATDGKSLLIGISIGLGITAYSGTRNHIVLPAAHAIQRSIRPVPQDRIDRENRKAAKAAKKLEKQRQKQIKWDQTHCGTAGCIITGQAPTGGIILNSTSNNSGEGDHQ